MSEEREAKRTRQACESCRRKKARCSGERPACALCVRLGQSCGYGTQPQVSHLPHDGAASGSMNGGNDESRNNADLAARVALLESRLSLREEQDTSARALPAQLRLPQKRPWQPVDWTTNTYCAESLSTPAAEGQTRFSAIPPHHVLESLTDVYFKFCQNQPYCYFQESAFRQRLREGEFPDYLLLAFAASAVRYSTHEYFGNQQKDAIEQLANSAWLIVLKHVFSSEEGLNLYGVQVTNLLAIIDFTAGRNRLGWVKIGLAIRFAQSLKLASEPDSAMPAWQQEEHRRVFWSVYLLDRFVSCCRTRPPTILDVDCTVKLPSTEESFRSGRECETPTLGLLKELPSVTAIEHLGQFALLVLNASTLGRTVRYSLQQTTSRAFPPWDFRSDFAKIQTVLLSLENIVVHDDKDVVASVNRLCRSQQTLDKQIIGHAIWSAGLYHLSCCLLYHPCILLRCLQKNHWTFPYSFARETAKRCLRHANQLTEILKLVQTTDCCARGSFLGYFAMVAGSVHKIYEHSTKLHENNEALRLYQVCLDYLEQPPVHWDNYQRMAVALRACTISPHMAQALLSLSPSVEEADWKELDKLQHILDYNWLSDGSREDRAPSFTALPTTDTFDYFDYLDGIFFNDTSPSSANALSLSMTDSAFVDSN